MNENALFALGCRNGWRVANALDTEKWKTASEVAKELSVQIATSVTHLKKLADAGIADRRMRSGGRKAALEYRLVSNEVVIELGIGKASERRDDGRVGKFSGKLLEILGPESQLARGSASEPRSEALERAELDRLAKLSVARLGRRSTHGLLKMAGFSERETEEIVRRVVECQ